VADGAAITTIRARVAWRWVTPATTEDGRVSR
jgi:hypothetical protein